MYVIDYLSVSKNVWSSGYQRGRLVTRLSLHHKRAKQTFTRDSSLLSFVMHSLSTRKALFALHHCGI